MSKDSTKALLRGIVLIGLIGWAVLSLLRIVQQSFSSLGGNDLYTYWYAGQFLREGKDLYQTFIEGEKPTVPIVFLDLTATDLRQVVQPNLVPAPASSPLAFFLMAPLAFLSWPLAKAVWLFINLALLGCVPFLVCRLFPEAGWLDLGEKIALICALIGLSSTRNAAASGQITFLVLDLMLASLLLADRCPWLAGLLLGVALSKYSLSLGILLLFLLIEPKIRLVVTACLVQLAGLLSLMIVSGSGLPAIVREYLLMVNLHAGMEGIHLAALARGSGQELWIGLLWTVAVAIPIAFWRWKKAFRRFRAPLPSLARTLLAVILILWALLVVYHRAYDAMVLIVYIGLIAYLAKWKQAWNISHSTWTGIIAFSLVGQLLLMIPSGSVSRGFLPAFLLAVWGRAENLTTTFLILAFEGVGLFLLYRLREDRLSQPAAPGPSTRGSQESI
jgi:hypothetical protein